MFYNAKQMFKYLKYLYAFLNTRIKYAQNIIDFCGDRENDKNLADINNRLFN